jgi:hypothetical protein
MAPAVISDEGWAGNSSFLVEEELELDFGRGTPCQFISRP